MKWLVALIWVMTITQITSSIQCNFESGFCMLNNSCAHKWLRGNSTLTSESGPSADHTTGNGYFAYVDSAYPNYPKKGPYCLELNLNSYIKSATFYYHMYGSDIGTLDFDLSNDGHSWQTIWTKRGDQGDSWQLTNLSISSHSYSRYARLVGTTGISSDGFTSIDDVSFDYYQTSPPSITPSPSLTYTPTSQPSFQPTSSPTTELITTESQLHSAVLNGGVLSINADIYLTFSVVISQVDIEIRGNDFKIDGQNSVACFSIAANVVISNLTITNGYSSYGGGIYVTNDFTVSLFNVNVVGNSQPMDGGGLGGGINCLFCSLFIRDSRINDNYAPQGGGISMVIGKAFVYNTTISGNRADGSSGALYISESTMVLDNTTISSNVVNSGSGGGLFISENSFVNVSNSNVTNNYAAVGGGGFLVDSSSYVFITATIVERNQGWLGGGLMVASSTAAINIDHCVVRNNHVTGWSGAGIYVADGVLTSTNNVIANNTASAWEFEILSGSCTSVGGCFYSPNYPEDYDVEETCDIQVQQNGSLFISFFSTESGYDYLTLNEKKYSGIIGPDCEGVNEKDVITFLSDAHVVSGGFEICYFKTSSGGGVAVVGGEAFLINTTIINNVASRYGGGLHVDGGVVSFDSCFFADNNAGSLGDEISFLSGSLRGVDLTMKGGIEGASSEAAICESSCSKGEYATCTAVTTGCFKNCQCSKCPAGTTSVEHSTSATVCSDCPAGRYSSQVGATSCTKCEKGRYATNNGTEDSGGLKYQITDGATLCNDCPAGYYAASEGLIICDHCDVGYFSKNGSGGCTICPVGKYSDKESISCINCPTGRYSSTAGVDTCIRCPTGYSSEEGSIECDEAAAGYYMEWSHEDLAYSSMVCPSHATCYGGDFMPLPRVGYWSDRNDISLVGDVYECVRDTCTGVAQYKNQSSCWIRNEVNASFLYTCDADDELCRPGSTGPLCGACVTGYTYSATHEHCVPCVTLVNYLYGLLGFTILFLVFSYVFIYQKKFMPNHWTISHSMVKLCNYLTKQDDMIRVLFASYQIIQSAPSTTDTVFPDPFQSFIDNGSFISFDFIRIHCVIGKSALYASVYIWSMIPILLCLLNLIVFRLRMLSLSRMQTLSKSPRKRIIRSHLFYFLTLTYMVLPAVTRVQFEALDCMEVGDKLYVRRDTSVNCRSNGFLNFAFIDSIFIVIYLSVPFIWVALLWRKIHRIHPRQGDIEEIVRFRSVDPGIKPIKFLFDAYKPKYWYFESLEMLRRIFFVSVLPLTSSKGPRKAALGFFLALFSAVIYREIEPFRRNSANILMQVAHIAVMLTFGMALALSTDLTHGVDLNIIGALLLLINVSIILVAIFLRSRLYVKQKRLKDALLQRTLTALELESVSKFITINNKFVSSTVSFDAKAQVITSQHDRWGKEQAKSYIGMHSGEHVAEGTMVLNKAFHARTSSSILDSKQTSFMNSSSPSETSHDILRNASPSQSNNHQLEGIVSTYERINEDDIMIHDIIHKGKFCLVRRGYYHNRQVAIHIINHVDTKSLQILQNEMEKCLRLNHRNIVKFIGGCWNLQQLPCCLFEFVEHQSLRSVLHNNSVQHSSQGDDLLQWENPLLKIATDVARGIHYLHSKDIVMLQGLTIDRILVDKYFGAKVECFGLSQNTEAMCKHFQHARTRGRTRAVSVLSPLRHTLTGIDDTMVLQSQEDPYHIDQDDAAVPFVAPELVSNQDLKHGKVQDYYSYGMCLLAMSLDVELDIYICSRYIDDHFDEIKAQENDLEASVHEPSSTSQASAISRRNSRDQPKSRYRSRGSSRTRSRAQSRSAKNRIESQDDFIREKYFREGMYGETPLDDLNSFSKADLTDAMNQIWELAWHPMNKTSGYPAAPDTVIKIINGCCAAPDQRYDFETIIKMLILETSLEIEHAPMKYCRGRRSLLDMPRTTSSLSSRFSSSGIGSSGSTSRGFDTPSNTVPGTATIELTSTRSSLSNQEGARTSSQERTKSLAKGKDGKAPSTEI